MFKLLNKLKRQRSILKLAPDIFKHKTVLYVGARTDRFDFGKNFKVKGFEIDVLEIFPDNVEYLKKIKWLRNVILGDVRNPPMDVKYDVVFWWHGCEHIKKEELKPTLEKLERIATKLVVLGCPYGIYRQDALHGNPYERHISAYEPKDFEELGYNTDIIGTKNVRGSNITAVKKLHRA